MSIAGASLRLQTPVTPNAGNGATAPAVREAPPTPELAALRACPTLATAPVTTVAALARAANGKHLAPGGLLAREGTLLEAAVVVVRGRLRLVRRGENGREVTVETLRAGDMFADGVVAEAAPMVGDLVAGEASTVLLIPRDVFLAHARLTPDLALAVGRDMARRLRRSAELTAGLALADVPGRVAWALRRLAREPGAAEEVAEGTFLRQRPTQQELANVIGACRETVSRIVSALARKGLVTPRGRGLILSKALLAGG